MKRFLSSISVLLLISACASTPREAASEKSERSEKRAAAASPSGTITFDDEESNEARTVSLIDQGMASYRKGDFPRAQQQLEAAYLLDRSALETWPRYLLFYCYLTTGAYRRALDTAEALVRQVPNRSVGYQQVGLAKLWLGEPQEAIDSFQRAMEFDAHPPRVYFYLGVAHQQLGREKQRDQAFEKAEAEYKQILKANPKDFPASYELASLYLFWNRKIDEAGILLSAAKESLPLQIDEEVNAEKRIYQRYYLPLLEGIFFHRKAEHALAIMKLLESLAFAPTGARADIAELYHYAGKTYLAMGQKEDAVGFLEKAAELDPKGPYAAETKALLKKAEL